MSKKFSVIFDMDGTLLDTQRICIPAWDYAGSLQGIENMGEHIYSVCGMNEAGWTHYLEEHFPTLDIPSFKAAKHDYIIKNGVVKFKDGARELIDFLKENGIKIGLASGTSRKSIDHHLAEVGITGIFDAIAGSHDVENGKPAPDVFLLAAERMGVDPKTCFVFEDSPNGIRAGYAAGMKCIGVPDLAEFDGEIKKLMLCELSSLSEAIDLFKKYI